MSLLWNFPERRVSVRFLALSAIAGLVGYLMGGTVSAAKYAGTVLGCLVVGGWAWATMERYNTSTR